MKTTLLFLSCIDGSSFKMVVVEDADHTNLKPSSASAIISNALVVLVEHGDGLLEVKKNNLDECAFDVEAKEIKAFLDSLETDSTFFSLRGLGDSLSNDVRVNHNTRIVLHDVERARRAAEFQM